MELRVGQRFERVFNRNGWLQNVLNISKLQTKKTKYSNQRAQAVHFCPIWPLNQHWISIKNWMIQKAASVLYRNGVSLIRVYYFFRVSSSFSFFFLVWFWTKCLSLPYYSIFNLLKYRISLAVIVAFLWVFLLLLFDQFVRFTRKFKIKKWEEKWILLSMLTLEFCMVVICAELSVCCAEQS